MSETLAPKKEIPAGYPQAPGLEWTSRKSFRLHGYDFDIAHSFESCMVSSTPQKDRFFLAKFPSLIQQYIKLLAERRLGRVLEIGIFRGGSAAFLQLMAKPQRLLGLELSCERLEALDAFAEKEGLGERFRIEYGVDQGNSSLVREHVAAHLGSGRCIDLVIDDASHLLAPTRTSFETVFPLLRPGASYIIEDYAAMHISTSSYLASALAGDTAAQALIEYTTRDGLQADGKPLHQMAVEAMLASIVAPGLIERVIVDRNWLRIVRGGKDFEGAFDLRALANDQFALATSAPCEALAGFIATLNKGEM